MFRQVEQCHGEQCSVVVDVKASRVVLDFAELGPVLALRMKPAEARRAAELLLRAAELLESCAV